jgi:hypothetical protein
MLDLQARQLIAAKPAPETQQEQCLVAAVPQLGGQFSLIARRRRW